MGVLVLLPVAVNSEPIPKVDSLPLLVLDFAIFDTPTHHSDHTTKSHPLDQKYRFLFIEYLE
jgi:hypothetical protein